MALDVIGAGFGRTSTHSLKLALEMIGFGPCHHLYEIRDNPGLLPPWQNAHNGQMPNWSETFEGFRSQVDWPGAAYWRELSEAFPKAKVILTVRDPEEWFDSMSSTILRSITVGRVKDADLHKRAVAEMIYQTAHQNLFGGKMDDRDAAIRVFNDHIKAVKATIPENRLLVYQVSEGWQPLCEFLGTEIPDAPFPHSNTRAEFLKNKPFLKSE